MSEIKLSKQATDAMVVKLQQYFGSELDQDLGQFDAEFLLDFIAKELGGYYYNQGLTDARKILEHRLTDIDDDIYAIEKPV